MADVTCLFYLLVYFIVPGLFKLTVKFVIMHQVALVHSFILFRKLANTPFPSRISNKRLIAFFSSIKRLIGFLPSISLIFL